MYKLPGQEEFLFYMLYTAAAMLSLIASCYLWFRRGNAFAPDITSSIRLRRWTATLFAAMTLSHVWYIPGSFYISDDDIILHDLVGGLLDSITVVPLAIITMLYMLQDRKRPLWPVAVMIAPIVAGIAVCIAKVSYDPLPIILGYLLLFGIGFMLYMVSEVRRYGRWLRENYADLEDKEVWHSFTLLAVILLLLGIYGFGFEWPAYDYVVQILDIMLVCYLLWRVETLSDLSSPKIQTGTTEDIEDNGLPLTMRDNIGPLLKQYCEEPQLYLQHDISLSLLAKMIGINRSYLSKHFTSQGTNYNTYINGLRIQHFIRLYHEAAATHQPTTAQQLAFQSGFHSYSTFSAAFKQVIGMTATKWMRLSES